MRKELVWAGVIGIIFGLIIAFGAWRISSNNSTSTEVSTTPSPEPAIKEFKITLSKPEQNDVITQDTVNVTGITKSLAWITVSGEKGDYIIQAGEDGVFDQTVNLIAGVNQIKVSAFDPTGAKSVEKVLVVFSSSFQTKTSPAPETTDNSSDSAIRQKVAEKVAEAMNKPKAYIGVVTDIADSTIQIKTTGSEIRQISTSVDGIVVVNSKGTNNKIVKLTDIAIGDFIVAMGYVNSKSVLSAQRILITDPVEDAKVDATYGKVTAVSKKFITVTDLNAGQTQTVTPGAKTNIEVYASGKASSVKFATINEGDMIIYVTDSTPDTPTVRSIFIVQKSES